MCRACRGGQNVGKPGQGTQSGCMSRYPQAFGMILCSGAMQKFMPKAIPLGTSFFTDILSTSAGSAHRLTGQATSLMVTGFPGGLVGYGNHWLSLWCKVKNYTEVCMNVFASQNSLRPSKFEIPAGNRAGRCSKFKDVFNYENLADAVNHPYSWEARIPWLPTLNWKPLLMQIFQPYFSSI